LKWCSDSQKNKAIQRVFRTALKTAEEKFKENSRPMKYYASARYKAGTWKEYRRVVCRIIVDEQGHIDDRYIVTSFEGTKAKYLYESVYCDRGNAELFIKEHKRGLKSDRMSCNKATANQFRLFLHSATYTMMQNGGRIFSMEQGFRRLRSKLFDYVF